MPESQNNELEIAYRCPCLGKGMDVPLSVSYRQPGEDLIEWMREKVRPAARRDHLLHAPCCPGNKLLVVLPAQDGAPTIGQRPRKVPA